MKKYVCLDSDNVSPDHLRGPCEATGYMLWYVACDTEDASQKEHEFILDRSEEWEATSIGGCKKHYEFVGTKSAPSGVHDPKQLEMRKLPCCCEACFMSLEGVPCYNGAIVGPKMLRTISNPPGVACPDPIQMAALHRYTVAQLQAYIVVHGLNMPPSNSLKILYIQEIENNGPPIEPQVQVVVEQLDENAYLNE